MKGINFESLRDAGDPVELGYHYSQNGADELIYLDISASSEGRSTFVDLVQEIASRCSIPFTVGGGISSTKDVDRLLKAGADKVTVNSAAIKKPELIDELASEFGSQCIVVAIDAKKDNGNWKVYSHGGKTVTDKELFSWASEIVDRGAGEILFTSMNHDGTKTGFAIDALKELNRHVSVPVVASGGAGNIQHFIDVFTMSCVDAALAASIFHYGEVSIAELKSQLRVNSIPIRE